MSRMWMCCGGLWHAPEAPCPTCHATGPQTNRRRRATLPKKEPNMNIDLHEAAEWADPGFHLRVGPAPTHDPYFRDTLLIVTDAHGNRAAFDPTTLFAVIAGTMGLDCALVEAAEFVDVESKRDGPALTTLGPRGIKLRRRPVSTP